MRTYYCTECDWFNQIMGRSGIGGNKGVEWHMVHKHLVFELMEDGITEKLWNKKNIIQKLHTMMDGRQLEPIAEGSKWNPPEEEDEELEPSETCIHDWKFEYIDVLMQLKTSEKELIRSKCKKCDTARVQGPAEKVKEVYTGPAEISINGQGTLTIHGGKVAIIEDSKISDLVVEDRAVVSLEADLTVDDLNVEGTVNGGNSIVNVKGNFINGGTVNVQ